MKPQFDNKVMSSLLQWFDNKLLDKGNAYQNTTGRFYSVSEDFAGYETYASSYSQIVADSSITGATIPTEVHFGTDTSGRSDGITFDFDNGRVLVEDSVTGSTITGEFAVKDFSIYLTNDTEDDLIVENKYVVNSRLPSGPLTYIEPYDDVVPAVFISSSQ